MIKIGSKNLKCRKGSILILVLIILASLTAIAVGLTYRSRIELKLSHSDSLKTQAYYLAIGGIEQLIAIITQKQNSPQEINQLILANNSPSERLNYFDQIKSLPDENCSLKTWLLDENALLDINKSNPVSWENFDFLTEENIACILDWCDEDNDCYPSGVESDYYTSLEDSYICKNSDLNIAKELTFIKGINNDSYFNNSAIFDIENVEQNSELDNQFNAITNTFTTYGSAKININTASTKILSSLPGIEEITAEAIINYRCGPDQTGGTEDDIFIKDTVMISTIEGLSQLQIELLGQYCCFETETLRLFSYAKSRNINCFLMATIIISNNKVQILNMEQLL